MTKTYNLGLRITGKAYEDPDIGSPFASAFRRTMWYVDAQIEVNDGRGIELESMEMTMQPDGLVIASYRFPAGAFLLTQ
jgi:hypothetical protein